MFRHSAWAVGSYTIIHLLVVDIGCILFWTQPVCMVPNQTTRNFYLQADDKKCISLSLSLLASQAQINRLDEHLAASLKK